MAHRCQLLTNGILGNWPLSESWFLLPERNLKPLGTSFGAVVTVYTVLVLNSG